MSTDKKAVRLLAEICTGKGINKFVFSPGSRSAPLVIAFSDLPDVECIVIPDERVAGYFALGIAQQLNKPVAVICTSGTAVMNLGPAIAEAFYQHIPLLILTADRPIGAAEKGDNQSINQDFIFKKLTKASYDINGDADNDEAIAQTGEIISLAIDQTQNKVAGPVHVNIRLREPLYNQSNEALTGFNLKMIDKPSEVSNEKTCRKLAKHLSAAEKKLIVVGMKSSDKEFTKKLQQLAQRKDVVVLTETLSNAVFNEAISNYDACLSLMGESEIQNFIPDVVITLGNQIISKRIRQFLKKYKPAYHWDIAPDNPERWHDVFDVGVQKHSITETEALNCLLNSDVKDSIYSSQWQGLDKKVKELAKEYLEQTEFSDLKVFETLIQSFPANANIQYGNSTPVRYANFFEHSSTLSINSNRGTSGIDGCVSTAAGAAYTKEGLTIAVVGDISFFYDSNALFNNYLSPQLRIMIINNSGGNIFRWIEGPVKVKDFEKFFETKHSLTAKHIASMYGIPYYFCAGQEDLDKIIPDFYKPQSNKPALLEIKTDGEISAGVYKKYFDFLKRSHLNTLTHKI